jgi:hypothetical protein
MAENANEMILPQDLEATIKSKCESLKTENPKVKRIIPIVIEGNVDAGEKPFYVAYMRTPDMKAFSKFMMTNSSNSIIAQQNLAKDCFVDGDRELLDDDELFLMGLMPQLNVLLEARNSKIVDLSKA